ncbi:MAG TPA: transglycosylase domain-containing protein [Actinopolymorphaceae bacterium]
MSDTKPPSPPKAPKGRRTGLRRLVRAMVFTVALLIVAGAAALVIGYVVTPIPDPNRLVTANATIVYYADGKIPLGTFAARNRTSVALDQISPKAQEAVIAAENRDFWTDRGISPSGIVRALWRDVRGQPTQGASTITQQYVKNYYLTDEQTLSRKVRELFITLKVQRQLDKQEILTNYLNTVYFGRGTYGIEAASQTYFGVSAKDLTNEQSAVLASMLKGPSLYDPAGGKTNVTRLTDRYHYVLIGMAEAGKYDATKAPTVKLPTIDAPSQEQQYSGTRGYLLAAARAELVRRGITEQELNSGGLRITTTFDPKMQTAAEKAVKDNMPTEKAAGLHVGLAAVEPGTGAVRAIYGGKNYLKQPFSDATQASWQPGSSFKAFTLAAMLKENIGLRSTADGNTLTLPDGEQVRNEFHRNYGSSVNMLYATEQSINTAFVDVTQKIGPTKVVDAAIAAGVPKDPKNLQAVPVVTLGVASETPLTMANAYATMAAQGKRADAHTIDIVKTRAGKTRLKVDANVTQTIDVDVTRDVTYALEQVVQRGTGTAARALDRPVAGKTGTHEDLTAWFMGYTPQLSASVGFYKVDSKGKRLSLDGTGGMSTFFGGIVPTKMWTEFMKLALAGQPVEKFDGPANIGGRVVPTTTSTPTPTTTANPTTPPATTPPPTTPPPTTPAPTTPPATTTPPTTPAPTTPEPTGTVLPTVTPPVTIPPRPTTTPRATRTGAPADTG